MTKYNFVITVPAATAAAINVAAAAFAANQVIQGASPTFSSGYLPSARLGFQVGAGNTGLIYIGGQKVTAAGANRDITLSSVNDATYQSQSDHNNQNLGTFFIHGTVPGDTVIISYSQE